MRYYTWKLELVSNILWAIVDWIIAYLRTHGNLLWSKHSLKDIQIQYQNVEMSGAWAVFLRLAFLNLFQDIVNWNSTKIKSLFNIFSFDSQDAWIFYILWVLVLLR